MALSAAMGLCALGADLYVLSGLAHQHAEGSLLAFAGMFELAVIGLWGWGYYRSNQLLSRYAREAAAIPQATAKLTELAQDVERRLTEGSKIAPKSLSLDTPLLDRRVQQTWRAIRRGAPLMSGSVPAGEENRSAGPERELRTATEIALTAGIAGTLITLLFGMGQPLGGTGETLLAHAAPGMASGLAAVMAVAGLRICQRATQDERDSLTVQIEDTISESFISVLPKSITSPEDRLASASEQLAQDTREILEYSFEKHNAATQKLLAAQAAQSDSLLKEHALLIGQVLTKQIQQPIQQLAEHAGALVRQSSVWAATAADLKTAHTDFLSMQRDAHEKHEAAIAALFVQHRASLNDFLEMARQANHVVLVEMQEATGRQIQDHATAAASHLATYREQFAALLAEQEAAHRRVTEAALVSIGGAVQARLIAVDETIGATLLRVEDRLPDLLRNGVKEGLDETIALLAALREQAAALAQTVAQVSGNADRQLLAYERWQERANTVQAQLEQTLQEWNNLAANKNEAGRHPPDGE